MNETHMPGSDELPGGPLAARPLHFFFIADCSGSMAGSKIQSLNDAIKRAIPEMQQVAQGNPNAKVLVQAIRFSNGAQWHTPQPCPVEQFTWTPLQGGGQTDLGAALELCTTALRTPPMPQRALPPVLVLVSDGQPTDDFNTRLRGLLAEPWGKKAVRIAIAIGEDADLEVLRRFMDNPELEPLVANNAETLVRYIRWASTAVLKAASAPASQSAIPTANNVPIPTPPPVSAPPLLIQSSGVAQPAGGSPSGGTNDVW